MSTTAKLKIPLIDDSTQAPEAAWLDAFTNVEKGLLGESTFVVTGGDVVATDAESRAQILTVQGAPGAPRTLTLPSGSDHIRPHIVRNISTKTVTVLTDDVGSSGFAIGPSVRALIYNNGVDIEDFSTGTVDATAIQGVPVSSTSPLEGQILKYSAGVYQPVDESSGGGGSGTIVDKAFLHLDANSITGLSNGDPVTRWNDDSESHYDAMVYSASPIYRSAGINGLPSVEFFTNKAFLSPAPNLVSCGSCYVVYGQRAGNNNANGFTGAWGGSGGFEFLINGSGQHYVNNQVTTAIGGSTSTNNPTDPLARIASVRFNVNEILFGRNAVADGSLTVTQLTFPSVRIAIGANPQTGTCFDGEIGEILFFNHELSSSDHTALITYLKTKWGIS